LSPHYLVVLRWNTPLDLDQNQQPTKAVTIQMQKQPSAIDLESALGQFTTQIAMPAATTQNAQICISK